MGRLGGCIPGLSGPVSAVYFHATDTPFCVPALTSGGAVCLPPHKPRRLAMVASPPWHGLPGSPPSTIWHGLKEIADGVPPSGPRPR